MSPATTTTLLALLLLAAALPAQGQGHSGDPSFCCFSYTNKPLPLKNLVSYEYAHHQCPMPAVIFTTIRNKPICADPQAEWTQQRIAKLSGN